MSSHRFPVDVVKLFRVTAGGEQHTTLCDISISVSPNHPPFRFLRVYVSQELQQLIDEHQVSELVVTSLRDNGLASRALSRQPDYILREARTRDGNVISGIPQKLLRQRVLIRLASACCLAGSAGLALVGPISCAVCFAIGTHLWVAASHIPTRER